MAGVKPGRRTGVRYSAALGRRICGRVAAGELLYVVCREPGMPTPQSVGRWARERPAFGAALLEARRKGGRPWPGGGGVSSYCEETAQAVFDRLCDGESLTAIGDDPAMPCLSTLFHWRRRYPAFEDLVQLGMRVRAERACDYSWELADAATPETAYLTHVKLAHLRWMTGVMAPRVFRLKAVEPEGKREVQDVLIRTFQAVIDPETGVERMVGLCPNPATGKVEREDQPGWRPPEGAVLLPGGAGQARRGD